MKLLGEIEKVLGRRIPTEVIAGFEPDPRIRPEPILRGGLGSSRPQGGRSGGRTPPPGWRPRTEPRLACRRCRSSRGGGYAPAPSSRPGSRQRPRAPRRVVRPGAPAQPADRPRVDDRQSPDARSGGGRPASARPGPRPTEAVARLSDPSAAQVRARSCRANAWLARAAAAPRADPRDGHEKSRPRGRLFESLWEEGPGPSAGRPRAAALAGWPGGLRGRPRRLGSGLVGGLARRPSRPCLACHPSRPR